jgi:hypothetical protein
MNDTDTPRRGGPLRRRLVDFMLPMAVYAAILMLSCQFLKAHPDSPWRVPVAVAPVVPIAFVVWSGIKRVREMDELAQRKYLEAGAFAYPTMIVLSITYGFLQNVGLPAVNWMYVGVCMFLLFALGQMIAWLRYR